MKSIILLAMSTLPPVVFTDKGKENFSISNENIEIKECRSQLEPVVRYFLRDSRCAEKVEILMLCTRQTLEIATDRKGIKYKDADGKEVDNVSAVTFFIDQINNCPEKGEKQITYKAFPLYREGEERILPKINCEDILPNTDGIIGVEKSDSPEYAIAYERAYPPDYLSGMREAIQSIRNTVKENKDAPTSFYIVTHGGPRDVMLSLNAVVSLLDEEGIEPTKICGTNLATKMIEDQKASFDMFRFVSGMRDFLNFGNVDMLKKYYSDSTTFLHGADRKEDNKKFQKEFLDAMNEVSIGVQYSNPDSYRKGLNILDKIVIDENDIYFSNSNLGIFKDTIQSDFGILLDENEMTIIDMVERCINKKQYQQALTFMESAFPEYYKKNNIISFSEDVERNTEKFNKFFKNHVHLEDKNKSPKEIIDNFCLKVREGKKETEIIKDDIGWKKDLEKELEKQLEYMKKQDNNSDSKLIIGSAYDFSKDILPVFKMHKTLKEIRNVFSHGKGGNRPDINYLDEYMRYYLKALKDLTQKQNSKDFNDKESCR